MTTKPAKKSTRNLKDLKLKSLAAEKHVKGGPIDHPYRPLEAGLGTYPSGPRTKNQ